MGIPKGLAKKYNQEISGFFGEFGTGANAQIHYLQTTLHPQDLRKTALISDIHGSEKWAVRDLFQRDVDVHRVTNSLLPYFQDRERVKFFNPITLTILPLETGSAEVLAEIPVIEKQPLSLEGQDWQVLEVDGLYRFRYIASHEPYGCLDWNDSRTRIVAIDGQHRLSALKRFLEDTQNPGHAEFMTWRIPVVIFGVRAVDPSGPRGRLLDVTRSIFVYINTEARPPSEARQILLTDESVNAVCTQELLQYSHTNDVLPPGQRDPSRLPLLMFDWRGVEEDGRPQMMPTALLKVEEVRDWFECYVLGEEFSEQQKSRLGVEPLDELQAVFVDHRMTARQAATLRVRFQKQVLPGIAYVLEQFAPFAMYAKHLRELEEEFGKKSDVSRHAFYQLRFGTNQAGESLQDAIQRVFDDVVEDVADVKTALPWYATLDVGPRGLMYAFGELRDVYSRWRGASVPWLEYAEWFAKSANRAVGDGWLDRKQKATRELLHQVCFDHNESVINYRLHHAPVGLGAYLALVISAGGTLPRPEQWTDIWEKYSEVLRDTLVGGYKKEVRAKLRDRYRAGSPELKEAVNAEAAKAAASHIDRLRKALTRAK